MGLLDFLFGKQKHENTPAVQDSKPAVPQPVPVPSPEPVPQKPVPPEPVTPKPAQPKPAPPKPEPKEPPKPPQIVKKETMHEVSDFFAGKVFTYYVNDAFRPAKSHAAEVEMLSVYAPDAEYGREGEMPYIAIQLDDAPYCAIDEYRESGTVADALEFEPLSGKFLFKAKLEYFDDLMYFYAFESEDGVWSQAGFCLVYQKEYAGTEDEAKLMQMLDEAAQYFEIEDDDETD